jgi:hypothetical protein
MKSLLKVSGVLFLVFSLTAFWGACRSEPAVSGEPSVQAAAAAEETLPAEPAPVISGEILRVDKYGNAHTGISAGDLVAAGFEPGDILHLKAGVFDGNLPLVNTYADVQRGQPLVRISAGEDGEETVELAISYGNFSERHEAPAAAPVSLSLVKKGGYKGELEVRGLTRSEKRGDYSGDAVFANFREVKTGGIPGGLLYRSCHPALGDPRAPYAARLAEQAGINTVINLADTREELDQHAAPVPWYGSFIPKGNIITLGMGVDFSSPDFIAKLKDGLVFMANHNGPYLIHCNEGKDRAGFVSALLEALMGAGLDDVVADYMESYVNYYGFVRGEERYRLVSRIITDLLAEMNGGEPVNDGNAQKAAEAYLARAGLSAAEISALKAKLSAR